jgi:hypothetical protein
METPSNRSRPLAERILIGLAVVLAVLGPGGFVLMHFYALRYGVMFVYSISFGDRIGAGLDLLWAFSPLWVGCIVLCTRRPTMPKAAIVFAISMALGELYSIGYCDAFRCWVRADKSAVVITFDRVTRLPLTYSQDQYRTQPVRLVATLDRWYAVYDPRLAVTVLVNRSIVVSVVPARSGFLDEAAAQDSAKFLKSSVWPETARIDVRTATRGNTGVDTRVG